MNKLLAGLLHSLKRIVLTLLAIPLGFFIVCLPFWLYGYILSFDLNDRIPPPGQMVDIGTHQLHLRCSGEGLPTVILEAGGVSYSAMWGGVRALLPEDIRVCSYDRTGLGWSESGSGPRNAQVIAGELAKLLEVSGEKPPWLFVGQSFGGTIGLTFVQENLENMAGFVAIETPTYAFMRHRHDSRFILQGWSRKMAGPWISVVGTATQIMFAPEDNPFYSQYSTLEKRLVQDAGYQPKMMGMISREEPFVESIAPITDFGSLPVVVIQGAASHLASPQWNDNQQELLAMSNTSKLIIAHAADHGVARLSPETILEGIDWVRNNTKQMVAHANHLE